MCGPDDGRRHQDAAAREDTRHRLARADAAQDVARPVFRSLLLDELDAAHGVLVSAAEWLIAKGIRQWTTAYPKELYRVHQARGANHGLFVEGQLAAVVTLTCEPTTTWARAVGTAPCWWMSKLATAPVYHGRGLGAQAVREGCRVVARSGAHRVYLDCVYGTGHLARFYEQLGFARVDRRVVRFSTGEFDMLLMSAAVARAPLSTGGVVGDDGTASLRRAPRSGSPDRD